MLLYSTLGTALDNNNQETLDDHEATVDEADGELHPLGDFFGRESSGSDS